MRQSLELTRPDSCINRHGVLSSLQCRAFKHYQENTAIATKLAGAEKLAGEQKEK